MKKVYLFELIGGLFNGEYMAQESPLEPGLFIIPELSTEIEPLPFLQGSAVCFVGGEWVYVDDNRGAWFKPNGEVIQLNLITDAPENSWTRVIPELPAARPKEVSIYQAEEALAHFNYLEAVEQIMDSPQTPDSYKRAWKRVSIVRRDSATMQAIAQLLALTEQDLDELFEYAAGVIA